MNSLDNISKNVFNCKRCGLCKENEGKIALNLDFINLSLIIVAPSIFLD